MICGFCGDVTFRNTKGKPFCRACQSHVDVDRKMTKRIGFMALPIIVARAMYRRLIYRITMKFVRGVRSCAQRFVGESRNPAPTPEEGE
jgi:hypothetical protein